MIIKNVREKIRVPKSLIWLIFGELLLIVVNIICYQDVLWMIPLQVFLIPYMMVVKEMDLNRNRRTYQHGFKELLVSLMTSMQAGYSFDNACILAYEELSELYKGQGPMLEKMKGIVQGIELHIPTDQLFMKFAQETGVSDAYQLSVLLSISNKVGTNMVAVLKEAMESMQDRMTTSEEIEVILSGKVFEKNIMLIMPFGILLYMQLTNPGYLNFFYTSLAGHLLMTLVIIIVIACYYWTEKILDINP